MAAIAWRTGALSSSGAVAAWTVGLSVLWGTGWSGGAVLAAFFVSSTLVSRQASGAALPGDAKGERRDAWQVYANGGPAAALALLGSSDAGLRTWLLTASLAAAAADTWATALGARSRTSPRLLGFGQTVPPGTSGGMTAEGSLGGLAGAALVAGVGALVTGRPLLLPGTLIGFVGMAADSLLGGTVQGKFWCAGCRQASEWKVHRCGTRTDWKSGWSWLNNDGVNLLATALAGGMARAVWHWID